MDSRVHLADSPDGAVQGQQEDEAEDTRVDGHSITQRFSTIIDRLFVMGGPHFPVTELCVCDIDPDAVTLTTLSGR